MNKCAASVLQVCWQHTEGAEACGVTGVLLPACPPKGGQHTSTPHAALRPASAHRCAGCAETSTPGSSGDHR